MKTRTILLLMILLAGTLMIAFNPTILGFATNKPLPIIVSVNSDPVHANLGQTISITAVAANAEHVYASVGEMRAEMEEKACTLSGCSYEISFAASENIKIIAVNMLGSMDVDLKVV